jgi:CHAD domain-containing protein
VARREPLQQVVELDTIRQRLLLRNEDDAVVAELDDDRVVVHGGSRDGLRFRQLELELLAKEDWSSEPVVHRLVAAGLTPESTPKLVKAMGLPSEVARAPRLHRKSSLADLLHALLVDGYRRLVDYDWRLRLMFPNVQAHDVHQARVGTRRLRSDLKTFGDVLDPVWVRHVRADLKWLGSALGDVRDTDVLMTQLTGLPYELQSALVRQRASASNRLETVLESERYLRLLDRLHAASGQAPMGAGEAADRARAKARDALPLLIDERWRAVRRQTRKASHRRAPGGLHRVRIKAKQLRYAAEAATPVIGKPARRLAKAAERVQSDLGNHHDAVAAESWLRAQSGGGDVDAAFEAGIVSAAMAHRREQFERRWRRSWKSLAKPKRSRWLQ